jgi:hypothetical protein
MPGAILWLDDDENCMGLFTKPRYSIEEECADRVIDKSTDFC